ncbi:transportin-3 [Clonorchis sinensis]|uniref:Transportin-3 n=1 Tax=Clonorchis sinensis TaxID=79923 RepID=G7YQ08_CLOSI|nr:transportin-3 [Clonorchis sinensis]
MEPTEHLSKTNQPIRGRGVHCLLTCQFASATGSVLTRDERRWFCECRDGFAGDRCSLLESRHFFQRAGIKMAERVSEISTFLVPICSFPQLYAWEISDQLLYMNRDLNSCYFGAQTIRIKVRTPLYGPFRVS